MANEQVYEEWKLSAKIDRLGTFDEKYTITKERYEGIRKFRERFFSNESIDAFECPFLPPEVAASWNRSREFGANTKEVVYDNHLDHDEYNKILEENRTLIDITQPLLNAFKDLVSFVNNAIYLYHITGIALVVQRNIAYIQIPENCVWDEKTVGTGAHSLCMYLKSPVQLIGLEYYSDGFAQFDMIVSAAPILDENGEAIACIAFRQDLPDPPWAWEFQALRSHTLGLIYAMATSVENDLKLKKSYDRLRVTKNNLAASFETLKATWSLIDEGLILIDKTGTIDYINKEGCRILKLASYEKENININDFLLRESPLLQLVAKGENVDIEDTICTGSDERTYQEQNYLVHIRPIVNQRKGEVDSAVLRLTPIEQIDAIVTKRSGAFASYTFKDIIGESGIFKTAIATAQRFAVLHENILLSGESGTGKELFAHAIHSDDRPHGPFIALNCAAIPRNLIESELLGYEGGSFSGADRGGRPGKIELANGGTLFLDEIGDMPFELQGVLLRVLEDKKIMRIGGRRYKQIDFKLIAATNRDLNQMVKDGLFREDLYYRLSVLTIRIPPLRERNDDVEVLSRYFIETYCLKIGQPIPELSDEVLQAITDYHWPGNVRQLENAMIYSVNVANDSIVKPEHLPGYVIDGPTSPAKAEGKMVRQDSLKDFEKELLQTTVVQAKYNVATAARMLNMSKSTLYRKLKRLGIDYR